MQVSGVGQPQARKGNFFLGSENDAGWIGPGLVLNRGVILSGVTAPEKNNKHNNRQIQNCPMQIDSCTVA
jgi:hypothetical protein